MAANVEIQTEISAALGVNAAVNQILHVGDDGGITATPTIIYDADGTASGGYISSAGLSGLTPTELVTANRTLVAADSGLVFFTATDAIAFTLPSTALGLTYTFVNIGADGAAIITISPAAADAVHGTITLAATVVVLSGTDDKDLINTKATAITGDAVTLVGDGVEGWYVVSSTGIWASEA